MAAFGGVPPHRFDRRTDQVTGRMQSRVQLADTRINRERDRSQIDGAIDKMDDTGFTSNDFQDAGLTNVTYIGRLSASLHMKEGSIEDHPDRAVFKRDSLKHRGF